MGCPAHIINNTAHFAFENLPKNLGSIIGSIYQYFSIYTIRVGELESFCDLAEVEYKKLLMYSKTRWLSLFPAIERILSIYPGLKSYFISQDPKKTSIQLRNFFEDELSEALLYFAHSFLADIHPKILTLEADRISVLEAYEVIKELEDNLLSKMNDGYLSMNVRTLFKKCDDDRKVASMKKLFVEIYERGFQYLQSWTEPLKEFHIFNWLTFEKKPNFEDIQECLTFLTNQGFKSFNENLLRNQYTNWEKFYNLKFNDAAFQSLNVSEKWLEYFKIQKEGQYSELLKLCSLYFCIPANNAVCERVFSHMNGVWTDERNRLSVDTVKSLLMVKFNMRDYTCEEF